MSKLTNASERLMEEKLVEERLTQLRSAIAAEGGNAFIIPMNDAFQSEYTPDCAQRIPYMCGFTGSAGTLVVTLDGAHLFVDGRYTLQAAQEVSESLITIHPISDIPLGKWLNNLGGILLFDPSLHTASQVKGWGIASRACGNLVDRIWDNQPSAPTGKVVEMPVEYAGRSRTEKLTALQEDIHPDAVACFVALPDAVNWLLNIRGDDVPYNPLLLCYALVEREGNTHLFVESGQIDALQMLLGSEVELHVLSNLESVLNAIDGKIQIDPSHASYAVSKYIGDERLVLANDPVTARKSVKNAVEIEGMKRAHVKDGKAVSAFLKWLATHWESETVTELSASDKLEAFRKKDADYIQPSFTTISGSGPNGAIVHYRVTPESDRKLGQGELYLVDSGGQYPYGTTDITRTVALGTPTYEMKRRYTQVLKGHIAIATAKFPAGTTGAELDVLARQHLWADSVDYAHGTGHGVGHYLCVHEGPQGISKRSNRVALEAGMVLSNEPGYYKTDEFGIRIENLVVVVEAGEMEDGRTLLGFETITLAPMDETLVEWVLLTSDEKAWWEAYHRDVVEHVANTIMLSGRKG